MTLLPNGSAGRLILTCGLSFVGRVAAVSGLVLVAIALVGLTALIACEVRLGSEAAFPRERDSAGVRIVEYGDIPADLATWSLSDTADLVIGSIAGDGPELFGRLVSVVELSDSTIVAADAQARELRLRFGADVQSSLWAKEV